MAHSATHKDPVFEEVHRLQIRERGCKVCTRRVEFSDTKVACSEGGRNFRFVGGIGRGFGWMMGV
ncbi:MAG: hypothetical protein COB71_02820 [Thiotrichales bacterium]|nr:MAG: hypothetical protein COB71_02820 [Thiotrichales bacterium]